MVCSFLLLLDSFWYAKNKGTSDGKAKSSLEEQVFRASPEDNREPSSIKSILTSRSKGPVFSIQEGIIQNASEENVSQEKVLYF